MINGSKVVIRPKSLSDAVNDYAWQTDPDLSYLTATPPLTTPFSAYLLGYIGQLRRWSTKHQFAIKTGDGRHIGNCACYSINHRKKEAEIGIMIGDRRYWDKGYGRDALLCLIDYVFNKLGLRCIHLKTLESNLRAQRCFLKCDFSTCGNASIDGHDYTLMELRREQWHQNGAVKIKHGEALS